MATAVAVGLMQCALCAPAISASCGGFNQTSCKASESPRACQGGLVTQGGRCVQKQIRIPLKGCGGRYQPPCSIHERASTCESGYAVNGVTRRCEPRRKCASGDLGCKYLR